MKQWDKIFMEILRSMLHGVLPFSPVSLTKLCSFCYGLKDLFTLRKLANCMVTSEVKELRDMDPHGQLG